jgi:hypothetical protein
MVVLPSTGVSHYHNCYIDGGTSPEYFGYHLVHTAVVPPFSALLETEFWEKGEDTQPKSVK